MGLLIALRAKSKGGMSPAAYLHFPSFGFNSEPSMLYVNLLSALKFRKISTQLFSININEMSFGGSL